MKTKTAILAATVALIAFIAVAGAANWYYSAVTQTVVNDYTITIIQLPSYTVRNTNVTLQGVAALGGTPLSGVTVTFFLNDAAIGTNVTNISGEYSYTYNVTQPGGSVLNFKAGFQA